MWSAVKFVVFSGRSRNNSRNPLTVPARWVACKGGLCFNPSSRVAQLAGAPSLHVNRPLESHDVNKIWNQVFVNEWYWLRGEFSHANTPGILSVNIRNKSTNKVSLEKSESCNRITWLDFFRLESSCAHFSLTLGSMKSNASPSASVTPDTSATSVSWSLLNIIPIFFPPYCSGKENMCSGTLVGSSTLSCPRILCKFQYLTKISHSLWTIGIKTYARSCLSVELRGSYFLLLKEPLTVLWRSLLISREGHATFAQSCCWSIDCRGAINNWVRGIVHASMLVQKINMNCSQFTGLSSSVHS